MNMRFSFFCVIVLAAGLVVTSCGHSNGQIQSSAFDQTSPTAEQPSGQGSPENIGSPNSTDLPGGTEDAAAESDQTQNNAAASAPAEEPQDDFEFAALSKADTTYFDEKGKKTAQIQIAVSFDENNRAEKVDQYLSVVEPPASSIVFKYSPEDIPMSVDFSGASIGNISFDYLEDNISEIKFSGATGINAKKTYVYSSNKNEIMRAGKVFVLENGEWKENAGLTETVTFDLNFMPVKYEYCSSGNCSTALYGYKNEKITSSLTTAGKLKILTAVSYDASGKPVTLTLDTYQDGFLSKRLFVKALEWDTKGRILKESVDECTLSSCTKIAERTFEYFKTNDFVATTVLPLITKMMNLTALSGTLLYANEPKIYFGSFGLSFY